ncbi:MAG: phenylalanine--tRNA ligase subunit beta [Candidatus Saccharimonadales bacterium]
MKISLNAIRQLGYGKLVDLPVDELVKKIGAQLGEVEEVINVGEKYDKILAVKVVGCVKHPNADKLSLCKIDDGGKAKGVTRDEQGYVQVVCGAPNVREGLTVAWLPPGSIVPSTFDKEKFTLEARDLRGETSNGMLASPAELAIGDNHDGILEIDKDAKPGTPFAEVYALDDYIIDVENKMFTHRPDCFGLLGVARELAGIQDLPFKSPNWYIRPLEIENTGDPAVKGLEVTNEIPKLVPRYQALVMSGVKVGPSPIWLQVFLAKMGAKSINNIVDMTNFVMLTTGQPLHAFDFDKVAVGGKAQIVVRHPKKGEKLSLLDGKTIEPRKDAILIADHSKAIALGGVMGGNNSEISSDTKRIIIESANFDMYNIRRTSMAHGLFTDAVTRFNKGQSPWQTEAVLAWAAELTKEFSPSAHVVGKPVDNKKHLAKNPTVTVGATFINDRLGLKLKVPQIAKRLENVEFHVEHHGDQLEVTAPFWRTDIAIPEDIVEEVGRLIGYDQLPVDLPKRDLTPANPDEKLSFKKRLRDILSKAGANEVLTYSFVHGNLLTKTGQDPKQAFELSNALSPDLQYYRMSLMPSLLDKVHGNIKAGYDQFALFEMNKVHSKVYPKDEDGLPAEYDMLALVFAANDKAAKQYAGAPYYQARTYLDYLAEQLGLSLTYAPIDKPIDYASMQPYDQSRSAIVSVTGTDIVLGAVGEFRAEVLANLKLPAFTAGFAVGLGELQEAATTSVNGYAPLAKYPRTSQDVSFKLLGDVSYAAVASVMTAGLEAAAAAHGYEFSLEPLDIYAPAEGLKHVALRVTLWHAERTLKTSEVSDVMSELALRVKSELKGERI